MNNTIPYADNLIPFDDTYILYNPDDIISFVSCYFSLLPIFILIFYFSWFLTNRELEAVIMAGGHVLNDISNNIIKTIVKQPRPNSFGSFQQESIRSNYGMPSAHSQFMGFLTAYVSLKLWLQWVGIKTRQKILGLSLLILMTIGVTGSRVYLGYHTIDQVCIGVLVGILLGSLYFFVVGILRYIRFIDYILTWPIIQWFYIKDTWYYTPSSLQEEYEVYCSKRKVIDNTHLKKIT